MNKPSTVIKIAAFFFLVGGMLHLVVAVGNLVVSNVSTDSESMRDAVSKLVNIISAGSDIVSIIVGWYLIKLKRWAYVLGLILVILTLAMNIFTFTQFETTRYYGLALSATILILLILGRKDFKKNQ